MENTALPAALEVIKLECSPAVRAAAGQLVASKYTLDSLCRSESGRWLVNRTCPQLLNLAQSALVPSGFFHAVLPFAGPAGDEQPALVPVDAVIGESWRWRQCTPGGRSEEELEQLLLNPRKAFKDEEEASRITLIPELGVGFANEGKNRILFLRDRGVDLMPSSVAIACYPAADRLLMIYLHSEGWTGAVCVLDGRWVRRLILPELSRLVLSAYGVPIASHWPGDWPSAEKIAHAIKEAERGTGVQLRPIDLHELESPANETLAHPVPAATSLFAACAHLLLWRKLLGAACMSAFVAAGALLLPAPWSEVVVTGQACLVLGAAAMLLGPFVESESSGGWKVPRRDAEE